MHQHCAEIIAKIICILYYNDNGNDDNYNEITIFNADGDSNNDNGEDNNNFDNNNENNNEKN